MSNGNAPNENMLLDKWNIVLDKVVFQPVANIFFILFAPLNVSHHFLFSLLLSPRSCTGSVLFIEALQLNKEEETQELLAIWSKNQRIAIFTKHRLVQKRIMFSEYKRQSPQLVNHALQLCFTAENLKVLNGNTFTTKYHRKAKSAEFKYLFYTLVTTSLGSQFDASFFHNLHLGVRTPQKIHLSHRESHF